MKNNMIHNLNGNNCKYRGQRTWFYLDYEDREKIKRLAEMKNLKESHLLKILFKVPNQVLIYIINSELRYLNIKNKNNRMKQSGKF